MIKGPVSAVIILQRKNNKLKNTVMQKLKQTDNI